MIKVVLDTNIFISALIFPGSAPEKVFDLCRNRNISLYTSPFILNEVKLVLTTKFDFSNEYARALLDEIMKFSILVRPEIKIYLIKEKDSDNKILECAIMAKADFLISGDKKHILIHKKIRDTKIVSAREFLDHCDLTI